MFWKKRGGREKMGKMEWMRVDERWREEETGDV